MTKLNADGLTEQEFLKSYCPGDYERPSVTVDTMVLRMKEDLSGIKILLIQRKNHPCIEQWSLPGGFVDIKESAYTAACRELAEETGLNDVYLEQLYTMSQPDRDPRMRVIDIAYIALLPYGANAKPVAGDDAKEALWFDIDFNNDTMCFYHQDRNIQIKYNLQHKYFQNGVVTIPGYVPILNNVTNENNSSLTNEALAFDHAEIVLEGLLRLRNKVMYSDIAFNLVPPEFTLPDLQAVYEVILGKEQYKTNFRNKIAEKVVPLNKTANSIVGNKKSSLFQYRNSVKK